ncbi:Ejaculatory bulb-specific protein 3 [Gryllus bimaculatus]|nr:Ejaculatory bulb-specific protein 3 [Gryllus bimaculatus]
MKAAVALCLALVVALVGAAPADKYSSRFDHVDVDAILHNDRLLDNYIKCLENTDDKGCTQEGKALKDVLAEAIATDCAKCTDVQKGFVGKIIPFLRKNRVEEWKRLQAKYDPQGAWAKAHPDV